MTQIAIRLMRQWGGGKPFSIAQSLEVAEHLYAEYAENFVRTLTSLSDIILFSAAIPHQGGTHHVNEQPPAYWADIFKKYDYVCFDIVRPKVWENTKIAYWYRQNIMLYVHKGKAEIFEALGYKITLKPMHIIHPLAYPSVVGKCWLEIERLNKKLNKTFFRRLNRLSKKLRGKL